MKNVLLQIAEVLLITIEESSRILLFNGYEPNGSVLVLYYFFCFILRPLSYSLDVVWLGLFIFPFFTNTEFFYFSRKQSGGNIKDNKHTQIKYNKRRNAVIVF